MKRLLLLAIILVFAFSAASGETPAPEGVFECESALPLMEMLMASDRFMSFEEAPDALLAADAIGLYRLSRATAPETLTDGEIYALLFTGGEWIAPAEEMQGEILPVRAQIESAVESGTGTYIVSVRCEKDYGAGFEFFLYADFHILPDETAPFGARIARVFIPE